MDLVTLLVAAAQVGVIGAVSAIVAPIVFQALETSSASAFLRSLFPRYFATAAIMALVAAVLAAIGGYAVSAIILAADAACFLAALALIPSINAAKDRGDPSFGRLHRISAMLNGVGLVLALVALSVLVAQ